MAIDIIEVIRARNGRTKLSRDEQDAYIACGLELLDKQPRYAKRVAWVRYLKKMKISSKRANLCMAYARKFGGDRRQLVLDLNLPGTVLTRLSYTQKHTEEFVDEFLITVSQWRPEARTIDNCIKLMGEMQDTSPVQPPLAAVEQQVMLLENAPATMITISALTAMSTDCHNAYDIVIRWDSIRQVLKTHSKGVKLAGLLGRCRPVGFLFEPTFTLYLSTPSPWYCNELRTPEYTKLILWAIAVETENSIVKNIVFNQPDLAILDMSA